MLKGNDYKSLLLAIKEQYEDTHEIDDEETEYLFEIIDLLERKVELCEKIIREGRHIISD